MSAQREIRGLRKRCDCPRRSWPKCEHAWWVNFKHGEKHHRISLDKHLGRHIDRKADAEDELAEIRKAIKAGTFGRPAPVSETTLQQLSTLYQERYVMAEHLSTASEYRYQLEAINRTVVPRPDGTTAALGTWRLTDIVTDAVERFREVRRSNNAGPVSTNRLVRRLRALYAWGIRLGYTERTPFRLHGEPVVKLAAEHARSRRLDADNNEREKLLAACSPHLRSVVEAALETGCRKGEILSLQWSQVEGIVLDDQNNVTWAARAEIALPWAKTKTRRERRIPISSRLRAILEMRRFDPAGQPFKPTDYVFGNAVGQKISDVGRAWESAVLKAHGVKAAYTKTKNLTNECRAKLTGINLHFHDLRREAGSRWLEGGVQLHVIQAWLGHTTLSQTSTYLACTAQGQHDAMKQFEERLSSVQRRATEVETGGRKSLPEAMTADEKPNETKEDREPTIM